MRATFIVGSLVVSACVSGYAEEPAMTARAQEPWIAEPGQRVRISYDCPVAAGATGSLPAGCHRAVGTLVGLRGDTLTLSGGASTTSYPLSTVARLEVSRGRKSRWLAGAGVGFLVGTGATLVALNTGSSSTNMCDPQHNQDASPGWCLIIAGAGGIGVGLIGGLVGLAVKTDRWEDVPRDRLRVSIAPYPGGVVLGASLRF